MALMNPLWKRRKKQHEDVSASIPKVKIPKAEADSPLPKSKIEGSERAKKMDDLPAPREKSQQTLGTGLSSHAGSKSNFQPKEQNSRIPKAPIPNDPIRSPPSRGGVERAQEEHSLPPPREKSRKASRKVIPSRSGVKTAYHGQNKEKGKSPPESEGRPSRKAPKPGKQGLIGAGRRKNARFPAKKAKLSKLKKRRSPIPQPLLAKDDKIETKTPRKSKSPLKSKIPRN